MNYKYGGYTQMTEAAYEDGSNREHERLYQEVVADEPGYFYIYLSNDGTEGGEAYFDDFTILTLESYIVQQTDYYPYGLIARNFVRENEKETRELFQGKTYDELTGWYDFHARQYDAALGRWFGVDAYTHRMPGVSPFNAMANNPVMFVDPDGNAPITLAVLGLAMLKGALIGTGVSAATYGLSTLVTGQTWNWNQFGNQLVNGMITGGVTAGVGLGFSAGLNAVGVGVHASNFIGGALGSFTGTLAGGGMPKNPIEWATAIGSAAMTGNAFMKSNPLSLTRKGNDFSSLGFSDEYVDLPQINFSDRVYPWWWGETQGFLDGTSFGYKNGVLVDLRNLSGATGAVSPVYPEGYFIGGYGANRMIRYGVGKFAARAETQPIKSLGAAAKGFSQNSFKSVNSKLLSQHGITDIHKFKQGFLGRNAVLKHFDVVKHTQSGELLIIRKSTKEIIEYTGTFIR